MIMAATTQTININVDTPGLMEALKAQIAATVAAHHSDRPRIGIGITTHNRSEVFALCYNAMLAYRPAGAKIVVVDDASTDNYVDRVVDPEDMQVYRFDASVGIARAKNKCFELLEDCEHIFLFDDDTWPKQANWAEPYINSSEPHLMYIFEDFSTSTKLNDTKMLYADTEIMAYTHPRGCMCYFDRVCLTVAGGMYPGFGKWGWEHPDLSDRIYNNGLTTFAYMDVIGSEDLIYSLDEHEKVRSTVPATSMERQNLIAKNRPIYNARKGSTEFQPYKEKYDTLLTCYFNNVADPQRGEKWTVTRDALNTLVASLVGMRLVVLSDCLQPGKHGSVEIIKVNTCINPYFQRWVSYKQYIVANRDTLGYVFCVDATDVEVLRNPFPFMQPDTLYVGDEAEVIKNPWIVNNHKAKALQDFYVSHQDRQLMNAGLCGGSPAILIEFMTKLIGFYSDCEDSAHRFGMPDTGLTDMAAFNYVVYNHFKERRLHGLQVNTRFKANERNNVSWFKHK